MKTFYYAVQTVALIDPETGEYMGMKPWNKQPHFKVEVSSIQDFKEIVERVSYHSGKAVGVYYDFESKPNTDPEGIIYPDQVNLRIVKIN